MTADLIYRKEVDDLKKEVLLIASNMWNRGSNAGDIVAALVDKVLVAGFMFSGEGWNGEYPFDGLTENQIKEKFFSWIDGKR